MNTIKKLISMALSVSMVAASFTSAYAASSNSVTRIATVKSDDVIENVKVKITPKSEVESGSSIVISIENANFDVEKIEKKTNKSYSDLVSYQTSEVSKPYTIKVLNDNELQVYLSGITEEETNYTNAPYYLIPIVAISDTSKDDIKITIDDNSTSISSGTLTVAKSTSKSGNTKTSVHESKKFSDVLYVDTITVKESVYGTFDSGEVKVRVNGGFKIVDNEITVSAGLNLDNSVEPEVKIENNGSYFTFKMPDEWTNTDKVSSFLIKGVKIEADDEDKNYGDVKLTISGSSANIIKETITVGTRQDYGFEFITKDEIPTIVSGQTWYENNNLDSDEFKSATIKFSELTADTWITSRKLEFTVPTGVKIVDVDFDEIEEIVTLDDNAVIANDGTTLRLNKGIELTDNRKDDDIASFEMNLYLSIDADYTGDVTLSVTGGGIAADEINDIIIAEAVTPIKVETNTTVANLGYQTFDTADIVISETKDGALLEDGEVVISFDDKKFGGSELGFNDTDIEYAIDGELEIKDFKVTSGTITFKVDKNSYTEGSIITIFNVKVGTTKSIPYGKYALKVSGKAVINNFKKNIDDIYPIKIENIEEKNNEDRAYFDTTDGYSFDNYVEIVTEAGTLDGVVEVTIGEKTITVNGEPVNMDVAAYIQTSSNSTMVPLRFVSLALGVDTENVETADNTSKITWDANSKTATILYNSRAIQFQANSNYVNVEGIQIPMENNAIVEIVDGRLFIPFRTLGQVFGVPVTWNSETKTAIYN